MRGMRSWALASLACSLAASVAVRVGNAQQSPAASLYTPEQAARGEMVYQNVCIECHETLQYTSPDFKRKWNGRTVYALFDVLASTMPDKNPGVLSNQEYIDVLAYMLKLNGVPPGKTDLLAVDSILKKIKIEFPPQFSRGTTPGSAARSTAPHRGAAR